MPRGEIWWADLGGAARTRPVLLLTRNEGIRVRSNVTIAPITTRVRSIPTEVALGPEDGLPRPCAANLDSLQTIGKAVLRERIDALSPEKLAAVEEAIRF